MKSCTLLKVEFPAYVLDQPQEAYKVSINGGDDGFVFLAPGLCGRPESGSQWYISYASKAWDGYGWCLLRKSDGFNTMEEALEAM